MNLQTFEQTSLGQPVAFEGDASCPRHENYWYQIGRIVDFHYNELDQLLSCDVQMPDGFIIRQVQHTEISRIQMTFIGN